MSVTEYLDTCLKTAYQKGFLWVMVLLARERDATHSYQELTEYWESFDDLTGDTILFVLSSKNEKTSPFLNYKYNPNMYVANKLWHNFDVHHSYRSFLWWRSAAIYNNTQYVSEIRHTFNIGEENIPAILLFKLNSYGHEKPVVIPISEDNLYNTIQGLIVTTEPILNEIRALQNIKTSEQHLLSHNNNSQGRMFCNEGNLKMLHEKLDNAVLQYAQSIKNKKSEGENIMGNDIPHFKIGITFSGKYRKKIVEPIVYALLDRQFSKDDIFYDFWHQVLINGVNGDNTIREIYRNRCDCVVVLLSPDYKERNWPGHIEWSAIKELINTGDEKKLCLLGIDTDADKVDEIDGLYANQAIFQPIDNMSPAAIADFINQKYHMITGK